MFKVTHDLTMDIYYVHKKLLWFWVRWSNPKSNVCSNINLIYWKMKQGQYDFGTDNEVSHWITTDTPRITTYYDNAEDYLNKNVEYFI